jgi:CO/xanthine dehydrogenase Mo-binding subunit
MAESEPYRPWTWKIPETHENTKRHIRRQDALDKISGRAVYTRDIYLPGMLYAKILVSPHAHARIASMDTGEAAALAGVRDILRFDDPDISEDRGTAGYVSANYSILTLPGISDFYSHPMGVAVVADSEEICDRALRSIKIQWEEQPFVLNMEESLKQDAPRILPEVKRLNPHAREPNTVLTEEMEIGDVRKGFAEADKVIEYTIQRGINTVAGTEAMVCVSQWRGDFLDIWVHTQHNMQASLSSENYSSVPFENYGRMYGRPVEPRDGDKAMPAFTDWTKITLTYPYQGAWYGGIAWLAYSYSFIRLAAILAKRADGRPVKLLYDESNFYCGGDDAGTYLCKVGAKKDGTITAYHWHVVGVTNPAAEKTHECTAIPNIRGTQAWGFTNRGHLSCIRHGAACCVPHNVMYDRVAAEFGLDPVVVALKNDGCRGHDWEWVTRYQKENGFPQKWSLREILDLGKKAIGWDQKWHAAGVKKLPNGKMHGLGLAHMHEWQHTALGRGFPCLILRDGKVAIVGARSDMGFDSESGFRQCVATELGVKLEDIVVQERRSDNGIYYLAGPGGSFGTTANLPNLVLAARELKKKVLEYAVRPRTGSLGFPGQPAFFPNRRPEDLDVRDGMVFENANPGNKKEVREIADVFWHEDPAIAHPVPDAIAGLTSEGKPDSRQYVMARQAHFIEIEVDIETGQVDFSNIVCVNDVGHCLNLEGVQAQQYGGAIMGLGRSATEEEIWCPRTGVALNQDMIGYPIGTMNDYPVIQCLINESHLGYTPYGVYGVGENIGASMSGITCGAIYNAIGRWIMDYPITPAKVLKALEKI